MLTAEIITIGDELLIGQVVDTNSAFIAQHLNEWGISVYQITSVHDDRQHILTALEDASRRVDIVLMTGGLGPTKDDITKAVLCDYFHTELVYREDIHEHLLRWYAERPHVLNRLTDSQCLFPAAATMIPNPVGSAQVMAFRGEKALVISMPGVPREMMHVMTNGVYDYLLAEGYIRPGAITHRSIEVHGIPESSLAIELEPFEAKLPAAIHLAYLPHSESRSITLRLSGYDCPEAEVEQFAADLRQRVEKYL